MKQEEVETEKKYDEPHQRDSAKEDAQISKKKRQTKAQRKSQ
jgi:hypothetical protein